MCCSKFLVYVCTWVHLEDCCRVNASCEGLLIFFVQETEDRTWILSGVSYSGVLSKCSMLGMFCTAAHKVTLFGSVTVPPHTHILQDFQASSNRVRATAWLCCPASGNSRQMAKFLFFLSGQNFWVEKKGCVWRKLDIWQLYLRLLSFSVTKYEIECKYSEFLIFKQKPFFHFIILYGVSFLLSRLDSDEEEAINWRNSFCCHCKWN